MEEERSKIGKLSGTVGICCNVILSVAKLVIGLSSGMLSIVADAVNNLGDCASSVISLIAFKLSEKPADEDHPFGHGRYEYISGLIVAFLVMFAGIELLMGGIDKIKNPEPFEISWALYAVLVASIAVKLGMAIFNYALYKKINSTVLLATAEDSRNDVIATSAVLCAALIFNLFGINTDAYISIAVAIFILVSGVMLIKDTVEPLLGSTPDEEYVASIEEKIMGYDGVLGTHDLIVHDYGPGRKFASVHIEVPAEENVLVCHEMIDKIEQDFFRDFKLHMIVHYDPIVTSDEAVGSIRSYLCECAKGIYEKLSIHDLRIVPGEQNTNVIFDCVVPHSCPVDEKTVCVSLRAKLKEKYPDHTAVIKIDHSFVSAK